MKFFSEVMIKNNKHNAPLNWGLFIGGNMEIDEKYFSISDLVKKGIGSKSKIQRLIHSGKLRSWKFGRSRLIAESDLINFMYPDRNESHQIVP